MDRIWGAFAVPMAVLDSARDAILSIPDITTRYVPSFESGNGDDGGDAVKFSGEGAASIDYDKLTGRLLDNRNFREALAQGANSTDILNSFGHFVLPVQKLRHALAKLRFVSTKFGYHLGCRFCQKTDATVYGLDLSMEPMGIHIKNENLFLISE